MIFVCVGMQTPFDRLCKTVDAWAGQTGRSDIFMQIGRTAWRPKHAQCAELLSAQDYTQRMTESELVITHVGVGTIITAMLKQVPIIVLPRYAELRETRNNHQVASAKIFKSTLGLNVAEDEDSLRKKLEHIEDITCTRSIAQTASPSLLAVVKSFVHDQ